MSAPDSASTSDTTAHAVVVQCPCSASVVHCEDIPATIRHLSYAVDDLKTGCREFEDMMDNGEGWQCLSAFQLVNGRFTITLCKPNVPDEIPTGLGGYGLRAGQHRPGGYVHRAC